MPRRKRMYFDRPERFSKEEDGSILLPNSKVFDPDTKSVRPAIGKKSYAPDPRPVKKPKKK